MTSRTYWPIPEDWNALSSVERKALISGMPEWVYGTEVHRMGQARWVETWEPWRIFELLYGKDEPRPWEFTPGEGWRNWEFGQVKFAKPKAEPQLGGVEIGVLRKMREEGTGPQGKLKEVLDRRKQVTSGGGGNIPADFTSTGIGFGEIRTTSSTGGQKGVKPAKYSLLPPEAMNAIAEHFGVGASKYTKYGECSCALNATDRTTPEAIAGITTTSSGCDPGTPNMQNARRPESKNGTHPAPKLEKSLDAIEKRSEAEFIEHTESPAKSMTPTSPNRAGSAEPHLSTWTTTTPIAQSRRGAESVSEVGSVTDAISVSGTSKGGSLRTETQHSPGCGALTIVSDGRHQWRKGYEWSKSFDAMQRHAWAFWGGEDNDPETGTPHMAAVEFHAMVLLTFMSIHPEFDDRPRDTE